MSFDPMIFVNDVEASSTWYQTPLGLRSGHGGPHYETLMDGDVLALQLHHANAQEHGGKRLPTGAPRGTGVLLYFRVDDVNGVHDRTLKTEVNCESSPAFIELAGHTEFVARDPDGFSIAGFQRGRA